MVRNPEIGKGQDGFIDVEANFEEPRHTRFSKIRSMVRANVQLVAILVSVFLGFLIGILIHDAVQESAERRKVLMYIKFPGELFIRMLRMIIIPLTVSIASSLLWPKLMQVLWESWASGHSCII